MELMPSRSSGNLGTRPLGENMCTRDELAFKQQAIKTAKTAHDDHEALAKEGTESWATWEVRSAEVKAELWL